MDKLEIYRDSVEASNKDLLHLGVRSNISNRSIGDFIIMKTRDLNYFHGG
jgi:hypothetical protein